MQKGKVDELCVRKGGVHRPKSKPRAERGILFDPKQGAQLKLEKLRK